MASADGGTKAVLAALFANAGIAIMKFVAFIFTGSSSMLAESIHSVADSSNQGLLLWGSKAAKRVATEKHEFGHGRERYFWSFVVALVLFSLGGLFAIFEGYEKIAHPEEIDSPQWAFSVLIFAIILESYSFYTAYTESKKVKREDQSWWDFITRSRSPELPVVLLEDIGALVGLILALSGITLAVVTENAIWDGIGTVSIGILLVVIAFILAREMKSLLLGEGAMIEDEVAIQRAIESHPLVTRLIHMRTQHIGPDELLIGAKVEFAPLPSERLSDVIDEVETSIRAVLPHEAMIYMEPDSFDANHKSEPDPDQ